MRGLACSCMRIASLLLFALVVDHAAMMRLRAQEPEQVSGEVTCAECVITLDTVLTIGGLDGPGLEPPPPPGSRELRPAQQRADGWLDLVDPATGRTIARYHQDGTFSGFAEGSSYVVGYEETDAGVPLLHILEPRLSRR